MEVAVLAVIVPATPPKATPVALDRFVPVTVTLVPPAVGPAAGDTEVMVGAAT